jgi:Tol biopolymer transport system component
VYLASQDTTLPSIWIKKADGSTPAEQVWRVPGRAIAEAAFSNDGQWLIYRVAEAGGNGDLYAVRPGRDTAPTPLLTGRFNEIGAALSPDGSGGVYLERIGPQRDLRPAFPEHGSRPLAGLDDRRRCRALGAQRPRALLRGPVR